MGILMSKESTKPWRDEELLRSKLEENEWHIPNTAEKLGISKQTIYKWCEKHGIPKKPYSVKENLEELYVEKGMSAKEVGEQLYGSEHSVLDWLRRHDIPVRKPSIEKNPHFRTHQGYEKWTVGVNGSYRDVHVHRLLAVAEYGYEEVEGKDIHHKNGVKWDNRPENIELLTTEEHMRKHTKDWDRDEKGRWVRHP